jgi:hypothetical protein
MRIFSAVAALLAIAILLTVPSCQKGDPIARAAQQIRSVAESQNPQLKDKPLLMTLSRPGGGGNGEVCVCMIVCSSGGTCTACTCSPANCGTCAAEGELAPINSVFATAKAK